MSNKASKVKIMGILNCTPDSFSDGGNFSSLQAGVNHAVDLVEAGADIIDIGGESTRPGSAPVSIQEELDRVIPVVEKIKSQISIPLSVDTSKAAVAKEAIIAGADIINDVTALDGDSDMLGIIQPESVKLVLMHMQGKPRTMQKNPHYDDVVNDIKDFFKRKIDWLTAEGISASRIIIDPGIGFGKTLTHNLTILRRLNEFTSFGVPVMLGHSRKRFIGDITGLEINERDVATAAVSALSVEKGVEYIRVHDVAATKQAVEIANAIFAS